MWVWMWMNRPASSAERGLSDNPDDPPSLKADGGSANRGGGAWPISSDFYFFLP
jgi:hypothetical protein